MAALPFDSDPIEELVLRFNALMAQEEIDAPELGHNASDDEEPAMMQETDGDLRRDEE